MYWEDNREQEVLRGRRLEEAKWCKCPRQKRKEDNVVCPAQGKTQPGSTWSEPLKSTAREEGKQREVRRIFKILREV